jgi:uncharacterized protein YidB (DUF937 family)
MASSRTTALLALLAIAGYQNRDKLGELLGGLTGHGGDAEPPAGRSRDDGGAAGGLGGVLGGLLGGDDSRTGGRPDSSAAAGGLGGMLGGLFGGGEASRNLPGGLGDLLDGFTKSGKGDVAKSWIETGANREVGTSDLASALGEDTIGQLTAQTGLSRDELLARLKTVLPTAVDKLTPQGRLPTEDEASKWAAKAAAKRKGNY